MNIGNISGIAFGSGVFVAIGQTTGSGQGSGVVLTSSDGAHWSANNFDTSFYQIAYGNGRFVLLGDENNYTSTDGVNWTPVPNQAPFINADAQLIYGNGVFLDIDGDDADIFASSQDGINWQTQDMGLINNSNNPAASISVTGAAYGDGMYAAVGTFYPNTQNGSPYHIAITSQDAVKWTMTKLSLNPVHIVFGRGLFMGNGSDTLGCIYISPDGANWMMRDTAAIDAEALSFCNGNFVSLGYGGQIATSPDGINWNVQHSSNYAPTISMGGMGCLAVFTVGRDYFNWGNAGMYIYMDTDASPFVSDGRAFVPVRYLADALQAKTSWDAATQTVTVTDGKTIIKMVIGSTTLTINGQAHTMDVAPVIRVGRAYLPARYVAEALGHTVSWDASTQTVVIQYGPAGS